MALTPEAKSALGKARKVCAVIASSRENHETLMANRREHWHEAQIGGASYDEIARTCGVARSLVIREIARHREKPWVSTH